MTNEHAQRFEVADFSRQAEGSEVVIGLPGSSSFLAVSPDIVDVLDWFGAGNTVDQVCDLYEEKHDERPELEEVVGALMEAGLLFRPGDQNRSEAVTRSGREGPKRWIRFLGVFFTPAGALAQGVLIFAGLLLWLLDPELIPGVNALLFEEDVTLTTVTILLITFGTLALHELAHMAAAAAKGVKATLGVSHRLWMLVVETDLSGLWALPRRDRFLPILAGPLLDAALCSSMIILLAGQLREWWALAPFSVLLIRGVLLISLLRIAWQCMLFMRTDFYFALAHALRCKSLMGDTEEYLRSLGRRLLGRPSASPLSAVPESEKRSIQLYGVLWILGRMVALAFLVLVQIPILIHYVTLLGEVIQQGASWSSYEFLDPLAMAVFVLGTNGLGLGLWLYSLTNRRAVNEYSA